MTAVTTNLKFIPGKKFLFLQAGAMGHDEP